MKWGPKSTLTRQRKGVHILNKFNKRYQTHFFVKYQICVTSNEQRRRFLLWRPREFLVCFLWSVFTKTWRNITADYESWTKASDNLTLKVQYHECARNFSIIFFFCSREREKHFWRNGKNIRYRGHNNKLCYNFINQNKHSIPGKEISTMTRNSAIDQ